MNKPILFNFGELILDYFNFLRQMENKSQFKTGNIYNRFGKSIAVEQLMYNKNHIILIKSYSIYKYTY